MAHAYSADPDQTAPAVWSGSTLFAIHTVFKKQLHKKQNIGQKIMNKVLEILKDIYCSQIDILKF